MLNELILPQRAVFVGGLVLCRRVRHAWVELVGVEPTSAQGNHTLSTRLFQTLVFEQQQDLDHQPQPYSQELHHGNETLPGLFPMLLHRLARRIRNNIHGAMSRSLALQGN